MCFSGGVCFVILHCFLLFYIVFLLFFRNSYTFFLFYFIVLLLLFSKLYNLSLFFFFHYFCTFSHEFFN